MHDNLQQYVSMVIRSHGDFSKIFDTPHTIPCYPKIWQEYKDNVLAGKIVKEPTPSIRRFRQL